MERPFHCHGRVMRNLSSSQQSLAFAPHVVDRELRMHTPVHYWRSLRTVPQQVPSLHEAVCEKRVGWHLLVFGSHGQYESQASGHCKRLERMRRRGLLDSCVNASLTSLPREWAAAHGVPTQAEAIAKTSSRGQGWWRWKPYLILRRLEQLPQGDVLVWADYDIFMQKDAEALWCLGQGAPSDLALFHFPCLSDRAWTKASVARALNATDDELDTAQIYAGVLAARNGPTAQAFVREWLRWVTTAQLATDTLEGGVAQDASFQAHRHDQSILSLLSKRRRIKSYPLPTQSHDVRDIWAWDAGYCEPGFAGWPLAPFRPPGLARYINHYKEMGHAADSMRHCARVQPDAAARGLVPMPDYVEAAAVLRHQRRNERLQRAAKQGQLKWSPTTLRAIHSTHVHVSPIVQVDTRPRGGRARRARSGSEAVATAAERCVANETFGGFVFDHATLAPPQALQRRRGGGARPHLWVAGGCHGVFRCAGIELRCARAWNSNAAPVSKLSSRGSLLVCECSRQNSLEALRHWSNGRDRPANVGWPVEIKYDEKQ